MANDSEKAIVLLTIKQGAERFGVHPNTIRNRINDKSLPAIRNGRNIIRINLADLEAIFKPYRGGEFGIWSQL
jgi:excisionase family DNA binding protein